MDIIDGIIALWFVSVVLAAGVGYWRGRMEDAVTLGTFLGPLGIVTVLMFLDRPQDALPVVKMPEPQRAEMAAESPAALRRAA